MKTKLCFGIAMCLTISMYSQNVWTGTEDDLWSNENNWSGTVPTSTEDVLIPTGFVVTVDTPATILSIEVQGTSILNVTETITIENPSEFEDNVVVNWSSGDLIGPGILLNSGTINLSFTGFDLGGSVVLNNPGDINLSGGASIIIGTNSVLNNSGTGIIDFQSPGSEITNSGAPPTTLNNFGTIKVSLPMPTDVVIIDGQLINTDGVFQVDSGTLNINTDNANFMGGEFNVAAGATMNWNDTIDAIGVFSGIVSGDLNWGADFSVTASAVFNFTGNNTINNLGGDLIGGGTLTNLSTISLITGNLAIEDGTTLENDGVINLIGGADLLIDADGTINNNSSGEINFLGNDGNIASQSFVDDTRVLNNQGTLSVALPSDTDNCSISINMTNNDGIIDIDNGTLNLNYEGITLSAGTYNIDTNGMLAWAFPINVTGDLTGILDGNIFWNDDIIVPGSTAFNFTGSGSISWNSGNIEGGGTLTNENLIIKTAGGTKRISSGSTLNNNGEIRQIVGGTISIATNSVLNNNSGGIIDLQASTSGFSNFGVSPNTFNNAGTLLSNAASGSTIISAQLSNSGTIDVVQNTLTINGSGTLTNEASGIIKGTGTLTLPSGSSDFVNSGTFAPGASPGILSLVNEYNSSPSSVLQVELNGTDQGINYDLLTIDGDANLDGNIDLILGFSPSVNDEFVVLNTSGPGDTIDQCDLPITIMASFGGFDYEFGVECRNNEELVLTVTNETLSISDENEFTFNLYPNPTKNFINITDPEIEGAMVYDINGREVLKTPKSYFSIENLENGVYFIRVKKNNQIVTRKVIKH
ncbi:T9SS type A sorting domain-containing protein [Winogradskyella sp.]|uniref:T9SS type A sorting domain-containing protein n=1 Tax=Winogradskyella sp. TaxID=1883156 RepID=UPI002633F87C|nr:T9SS type A sorting domain-containing protein [Winogradskyella sp.]